MYACVEIRIATDSIKLVSQKLTEHGAVHDQLNADRQAALREFERRVSRLEERTGG